MNRVFLLADDDPDDAELFSEALADVDPTIQFQHVDNGVAVFDYLRHITADDRPDLIFLDLNMPKMSGWQCLSQLKNDPAFKNIPVVMYTTSSHHRDSDIAIDLGAVGLITKPSDFKLLKRMLQTVAKASSKNLKESIQEIGTWSK